MLQNVFFPKITLIIVPPLPYIILFVWNAIMFMSIWLQVKICAQNWKTLLKAQIRCMGGKALSHKKIVLICICVMIIKAFPPTPCKWFTLYILDEMQWILKNILSIIINDLHTIFLMKCSNKIMWNLVWDCKCVQNTALQEGQ